MIVKMKLLMTLLTWRVDGLPFSGLQMIDDDDFVLVIQDEKLIYCLLKSVLRYGSSWRCFQHKVYLQHALILFGVHYYS